MVVAGNTGGSTGGNVGGSAVAVGAWCRIVGASLLDTCPIPVVDEGDDGGGGTIVLNPKGATGMFSIFDTPGTPGTFGVLRVSGTNGSGSGESATCGSVLKMVLVFGSVDSLGSVRLGERSENGCVLGNEDTSIDCVAVTGGFVAVVVVTAVFTISPCASEGGDMDGGKN